MANLTDCCHREGFSEALNKFVPLRSGLLRQRWRERHMQPGIAPSVTGHPAGSLGNIGGSTNLSVAFASICHTRQSHGGSEQMLTPTACGVS